MTAMMIERETASAVRDISDIIGSWREGRCPSTRAVLLEHPEFRDCASVVVQLAHEEYCLRREAGEAVAASTFCQLFPTIRGKLRPLLEVEDALFDIPLEQEVIWPDLGSTFLEFELLSQLGEGAAARVYLARQARLGNRYVAVKVSRFGGSEAETLGKLQHRHVVPVFSVHFEPQQGMTAVCMPYLGGATLSDIKERAFRGGRCPQSAQVILAAAQNCQQVGEFIRGEMPADPCLNHGSYVDGIVHMMAELADGLAYTHSHQVMHRDLKPSNVLVTPQGRPMLLDFNLSWDADQEVSRMGGTLPYMPSEQIYATFFAESNPLENDPRSDIFSLGVILYELLTGQLPFPTTNSTKLEALHTLLEAHSRGVPDIRKRNPDVSEGLARLIESCLDPVADMRPPTAADLAAQLRDLLPLASGPAPGPEAQVRRRGGVLKNVLAASLLCAAATPFAVGWYSGKANSVSPQAIQEVVAKPVENPERTLEQLLQDVAQAESKEQFRRLARDLENGSQLGFGPSSLPYEAYCHFRLRDLEEAIVTLKADPDFDSSAELQNNVGYCFLSLGEVQAAKLFFDSALRQDPFHPQALLNRAMCNLSLEEQYADPDRGVHYVERALVAFPNGYTNATLLLTAARIHALRARKESEPQERRVHVDKVQMYLDLACRSGIDAELVHGQRELQPVFGAGWFQDLFGTPTKTGSSKSASRADWSTFYVSPFVEKGAGSSSPIRYVGPVAGS
jgi:eukaryotic-like serine/threonine-protein kinase